MRVGPRFMTLVIATVLAASAGSRAEDRPDGQGTWWGFPTLPHQWQHGIPPSDALRVPSPVTRDDKTQEVSLKEAIGIALANNPGIIARRLEPERQTAGILGAQGKFDVTLSGDVQSVQNTTPNAASLSLVSVNNVDDRFANLHLFKTFRTGTQINLDSLNERIDNNASYTSLRPEYKPGLNLSLVQPLLRNFGWDFSYLVVRVAQQNADVAAYQYEAILSDFVEQVIEAYWNVVGARENLAVELESKALADRTVTENEARVKVGLFAPVAVLEAQADAAARQARVILVENAVAVTRQRLSQLAYFRPEGTFVPRTLEPIEEAKPEDITVNIDEALATALADRAEVLASAHGVQARQLNERIAENGLLPQLNLVGGYGVNAVSGVTVQGNTTVVPVDIGSFFPGQKCTRITTGPQAGMFRCVQPPSAFGGSAATAYDRLTSNDYRSYSFGVQLQVPLSNAVARSDYTQRRIELQQAEYNHRDLLSNVTLEVRQTAADLLTARQRIDATRVARELAEENLRNQEKRHEVGMATTKDLLDFQTRLTLARAAEVQSKIDHAIAAARWRRAQGQLLPHYQIVFERPGHPITPWFARF